MQSELTRELAPEVSDTDLATLVSGGHAFALELYQELDTNDANLMVSPFSIRIAFGLLQAGARGETAEEIASVLHYGLEGDALHTAFNALDLALADRNFAGDDDDDPITLRVANAFWGQTGYAWSPAYLDTIALNYGAGVDTLDYATDPEGSRETINTWVEDRTEDRIQDLLPAGSIRPSTVAVLTNALYFKAPWAVPFETGLTADGTFTTAAGAEVTTPFMNGTDGFGYASGNGWEALEMTFHQDELEIRATDFPGERFRGRTHRYRRSMVPSAA